MLKKIKKLEQKLRNFVGNNLKLTLLLLVVLIAAFTFISIEALHFSSDPQFCRNCHPLQEAGPLGEVYTWSKSKHAKAGVLCLNCHAVPGLVGYLRAKMGGLYDVYGEFIKGPEHKMHVLMSSANPQYRAKLVKNDVCMFCHTDSMNQKIRHDRVMSLGVTFRLIDGAKNPAFRKKYGLPDIIAEGVRPTTRVDPNHKKHLENGFNCVDCHAKISHSGIPGYRTAMPICFDCHDAMRKAGKNPPADQNCTACHRNVGDITPKGPISFGKGEEAVTFDHKAHISMNKCNDCHTNLFPMKQGSSKIRFADHGSNKYCYACHNGKRAFSWNDCTMCHTKGAPFPKVPIAYKPSGAAPVSFSHEFHIQVFKCDECHTKIWPMKRGAKKMAMDGMYEGKFCGVCHNGQTAFSATDCDKCHVEAKKK